MKSLRKILAVLTATAMVAGMGAMAFGAIGEGTITVKSNTSINVDGRNFNAYKILDASYSGSGASATIAYTVPSQMEAFYSTYFPGTSGGSAISGTAQASNSGTTFSKYTTDKIAALKNDAEALQKFVKAALAYINKLPAADKAALLAGTAQGSNKQAKFENLVPGYYLIEDLTSGTGKNTPSAIILDTITDQDLEVYVKANYNETDKSIAGPSGSGAYSVVNASGTFTNPQEANNATVGSTVNFTILQTVPNYTGYDHFYFIVNDTLSDGLTLNKDSIKVYVDANGDGDFTDDFTSQPYTWQRPLGYTNSGVQEATKTETITKELLTPIATIGGAGDYYVYFSDPSGSFNGQITGSGSSGKQRTFEIAFKDIMNFEIGRSIMVTYSANVNDSAIMGKNPNTNDSYITFSNEPEKSKDGDSGSDKPGVPASGSEHPTGDGPRDWTDTYTTKVDLTKVDNEGNKLSGTQFTLTGKSNEVVIKTQEVFVPDPSGTYYLLANGQYTETPPSGSSMVDANPGATSGYIAATAAEYADSSIDKSQWITVDGIMYRPYKAGESGSVKVLMLATDSDYDSTVIKYRKDTISEQQEGNHTDDVTMVKVTNASGTLFFGPLGEGEYKLSETLVPEGFNKAEDVTFKIKWHGPASGSETATCWWEVTDEKTGNTPTNTIKLINNSGSFSVTVVNNKGVELPSTGGIGTTIFYAGGALLVLMAGILLVSKRRIA